MTEQQIKRIREVVNTPNTAIQCETKEEARMLFEAMGWEWKDTNMPWCDDDRAYYKDSYWPCGWDRQYTVALGKKSIISFSTLLTPEPCGLIKVFRAVGLDWMEEGVEFTYENHSDSIYRVTNGRREVKPVGWNSESWRIACSELGLIDMLNNPHKIHQVRVWGEETIEDAKAAVRLGFDMVNRDSGGETIISHDNDAIAVQGFKELQPGECVALADIVGGCENG